MAVHMIDLRTAPVVGYVRAKGHRVPIVAADVVTEKLNLKRRVLSETYIAMACRVGAAGFGKLKKRLLAVHGERVRYSFRAADKRFSGAGVYYGPFKPEPRDRVLWIALRASGPVTIS